ncbi:hypothetical protein K3495_g15265, partial [Podosphaera aphanis]
MPTTTTEVRGFVNAAGYFRHLIDRYAEISGPLTNFTGGGKNLSITLSPDAISAWRKIRDIITSLPVVRVFDWRKPVVLETDASKRYVGSCLLQPHFHGNISALHPVAYFSKKLSETQSRYASQERELLAILLSLQHWRLWVEGGDVTVVTDHESLKTLSTKVDQPNRILRFLDAIEHYGVKIIYRPGKANVLADYLSRPTVDPDLSSTFPAIESGYPDTEIFDTINNSNIPLIEHPHQLNRLDLQSIFEFLQLGTALPAAIHPHWVQRHFTIYNNSLYRIMNYSRSPGDPPNPNGLTPINISLLQVPEYYDLTKFSKNAHFDLAHASVGTTLRHMLTQYWHPEIILTVQQVIAECPQCQLMRRPDNTLPDLQPIIPPPPLTRWAIDFTAFNGINLLVAVEYATGWIEVERTNGQTFVDTISLLTRICQTFGSPLEWISDNAGCFSGTEAKEWHLRHGSKVMPVTPMRPRGNGKVEKANGDIKRLLVREFHANPNIDAKQLLPRVVAIKNRTPGPSGYSPYFLLFGTQP